MVVIVVIVGAIVFAVITAIVGTNKDNQVALSLKSYLGTMGFITSGEIEVFNKDNQGKPFRFLIDKYNQKWTLANYRATTANIYDYSDLLDYAVTYRTMGTDIIKGKEFSFIASESKDSQCGIIESYQLNSNNCEYIEIKTIYKGQAQRDGVCSYFILFEKQQSFFNAQNHDFHVPSVCINNAKEFENMLYEILSMR